MFGEDFLLYTEPTTNEVSDWIGFSSKLAGRGGWRMISLIVSYRLISLFLMFVIRNSILGGYNLNLSLLSYSYFSYTRISSYCRSLLTVYQFVLSII